MKIHSILYFVLMVYLLQGCSSSKADNDNLPGVNVEPDRINTDFILSEDPVVGSTNSHKNNDLFIVRVTNLVDSQIKFSPGYVKLFVQIDDRWEEIENLMKSPEVEEILPTTKEFPPGMAVYLIPLIPDMTKPEVVRIFFQGQNVNTGHQVGSYIDFTLLP